MKQHPRMIRSLCLLLLLLPAGCKTQPPASQTQKLAAAQDAYHRGNYSAAYRQAADLHAIARGSVRDEAAYLAGLSAHRLGNAPAAESYLVPAAQAHDAALAADAGTELGLLYSELGRYHHAAVALLHAAPALTGEHQANAYFHAAVAQQKIGQWAQARTNLTLARAATENPEFRDQIQAQLAVTGYAIQTGAFLSDLNARRAADALADKAAAAQLGSPRTVTAKDRAGRPVTLVQIGRFSTFASANAARLKLAEPHAIIVPLSQ